MIPLLYQLSYTAPGNFRGLRYCIELFLSSKMTEPWRRSLCLTSSEHILSGAPYIWERKDFSLPQNDSELLDLLLEPGLFFLNLLNLLFLRFAGNAEPGERIDLQSLDIYFQAAFLA